MGGVWALTVFQGRAYEKISCFSSGADEGLSAAVCLCAPQTRQPVFVQLLQGVFRVYHCTWLVPSQKGSVEACIKVLSDVGKTSSGNTNSPSDQ